MPIDISDVRCKRLFVFFIRGRIEAFRFDLKLTKKLYMTRHKYKTHSGCWVFIRWQKYSCGGIAVKSCSVRKADICYLQVDVNERKGHLRFIFTGMYLGQGCIDHKELDLPDKMALA